MLTVKGYFSPENFGIMNLALGLGERDYGVTILTGKRNYPAGQLYAEQELLARSDENYSLSFIIVSGGFTAVMDFISSFVVRNYEYPGQTYLWVFTYIFFGWIGMCGSCLLLAEGILARRGQDMLTQPRLWWQVPLLTGVIAVVLDLFIDPVAVAAGYWVWFVQGTVYYGIPLLNYVGWFVLMFLAPLAWICIARHRRWSFWQKEAVAIGALVPLCIALFCFRWRSTVRLQL